MSQIKEGFLLMGVGLAFFFTRKWNAERIVISQSRLQHSFVVFNKKTLEIGLILISIVFFVSGAVQTMQEVLRWYK